MRTLILLVTLSTLAAAQQSGYNYNPTPIQHHQTTGSISRGSDIASLPIFQQAPQTVSASAPAQVPVLTTAPAPVIEEVNKEFYIFSAPEEEFAIPQQEQLEQSVTKKNLQVIFIHAPQQPGLNRVLQNIAQQTSQQQTAIYVLTKQPDLSQITNTIQRETNHVSHKPEVHFVKYRTQEDAQRAQQSIQAQYDALGGSTSHNNGGVATVLNFASQQQNHQGHQGHQTHQQQAPVAPSQTYLPVSF